MIKSFRSADTQALFETGESKRSGAIITVATRKLTQLDAAATLEFLKSPHGNHLKALKGDRKEVMQPLVYDFWKESIVPHAAVWDEYLWEKDALRSQLDQCSIVITPELEQALDRDSYGKK